MVDVEHRALRALEEHRGPVAHPPVQEQRRVGDVGPEPLDGAGDGLHDLLHLEGVSAVEPAGGGS